MPTSSTRGNVNEPQILGFKYCVSSAESGSKSLDLSPFSFILHQRKDPPPCTNQVITFPLTPAGNRGIRDSSQSREKMDPAISCLLVSFYYMLIRKALWEGKATDLKKTSLV